MCDASLVKCWDNITAGGEELQLERLPEPNIRPHVSRNACKRDDADMNIKTRRLDMAQTENVVRRQTFGTAAWNTKSDMSASEELEAWMVMTEMFGFGLDLSKVNSIFKPFLLYAVIGGIAAKKPKQKQFKKSLGSIGPKVWSPDRTDVAGSSPAAVSLKSGCEERPSKRNGGWDTGTEGAGAGVGPPEE